MKYIFDFFVIGVFNWFVYVVVVVVVEVFGKLYNLLFIYGGFGLGKIYLLYVIGCYVMLYYDNVKVKYVFIEEFINDFINVIGINCIMEFCCFYCDVDVLLVDDI